MSTLLAIDPGPSESAILLYDAHLHQPQWWCHEPNQTVLELIDESDADRMAVEMVASYGMAVGADVFTTCVWSGRFIERWLNPCCTAGKSRRPHPQEVFRKQVKQFLCGTDRANDSNIRQALIDRYGPTKELAIGKKASPGPLYGYKSHAWAALGLAVTAANLEPSHTSKPRSPRRAGPRGPAPAQGSPSKSPPKVAQKT